MYKAISSSIIKEMLDAGDTYVSIKKGWEHSSGWSAKPSYIIYALGPERERIFSCYFFRERDTIQITNLEATKLISDQKALVDAYMYIALVGLIEFSKNLGVKRLIVDSYIPSIADHMLDLGFQITAKGFGRAGGRGIKNIEG